MSDCMLPMAMSSLACALAEGLTTTELERLSAAFVILSDCLAAIALCHSREESAHRETQPSPGASAQHA